MLKATRACTRHALRSAFWWPPERSLGFNALDGSIHNVDPEIFELMLSEREMHNQSLSLMAMESYPTEAVCQANNAYLPAFEGYPGKRYHPGTAVVDAIERLCWDRALETFDLLPSEWGVNAQAMTGSLANIYTFNALLRPGESLLRMELSHGGHISHGHQIADRKISETAHRFDSIPYHVDPLTGLIDYEEVSKLAQHHRPRIIVAGGSAYCRHIDFARLRSIADRVDALIHYDMSHFCGLVASGVFPSPFQFCDVVTTTPYKTLRGPQGALIIFRRWMEDAINSTVFPRYQCGTSYRNIAAMTVALRQARTEESRREQGLFLQAATVLSQGLLERGYRLVTGGTDCHMMLVDLRSEGISGYRVENVLGLINILANQNAIPGDVGLRFTGLRLATPPMIIRGMEADNFAYIAELVHRGIELAKRLSGEFESEERDGSEQARRSSKKNFLQFLGSRCHQPQVLKLKDDVITLSRRYPLPSFLYRDLT
ncbi:SHMT-domain-containing protein [Diplogelasinospora grovesii]|uniref:glycine hydroxymethyltransferase n=1 Tax=Diplogelasinospora grovesii TaxID=303347 RepID=A0AAN6S0L0_9PEZI|nr:SHMT-domain-containing protein [Diplogelasinospora grovesii]